MQRDPGTSLASRVTIAVKIPLADRATYIQGRVVPRHTLSVLNARLSSQAHIGRTLVGIQRSKSPGLQPGLPFRRCIHIEDCHLYHFDLNLPHPLVHLLLFLCKDGRGGLINAPFRLRQSGRGSSFFHAAVGEQDVVYARPCHRCSAQEHAEGSNRNGIYDRGNWLDYSRPCARRTISTPTVSHPILTIPVLFYLVSRT